MLAEEEGANGEAGGRTAISKTPNNNQGQQPLIRALYPMPGDEQKHPSFTNTFPTSTTRHKYTNRLKCAQGKSLIYFKTELD